MVPVLSLSCGFTNSLKDGICGRRIGFSHSLFQAATITLDPCNYWSASRSRCAFCYPTASSGGKVVTLNRSCGVSNDCAFKVYWTSCAGHFINELFTLNYLPDFFSCILIKGNKKMVHLDWLHKELPYCRILPVKWHFPRMIWLRASLLPKVFLHLCRNKVGRKNQK